MTWGRFSAAILLAVSVIVSGCTATKLKPEVTQKAKTVGVISAIGDDLIYRNVPFFRWDQEEHYRNVSAWAIDSFVTQEVSNAIQSRYTVVPVHFNRAAFLDKNLNARVSSAGMMPDASALGEVVRANVQEPKADLYVVVLAGRTGVATTATPAEGMGVLRFPSFGSDRRSRRSRFRRRRSTTACFMAVPMSSSNPSTGRRRTSK